MHCLRAQPPQGLLHLHRPVNDGSRAACSACLDSTEVVRCAEAVGTLLAELVASLERRNPECFSRPFDDLPELPEHHELSYWEVRRAFLRHATALGVRRSPLVGQILTALGQLCVLQTQPVLPFLRCAA
jgi:hypothetical protein